LKLISHSCTMDGEGITDAMRSMQKQNLINLFSDRNTTFANNRYTPEQIELTIYAKSKGNKNNYLSMMGRVLRSSAGGRVQDQQSIGQTSQRHPSTITSQSHIYSVPANSNQPGGFVRSNIVQSPNSARINSTPDIVQSTKISQTSQSQYVKRTEWNQQPTYQPYSVPARLQQQQQLGVDNVTLLSNQGMSPAQSIQAQIINSSPGLKTPGSSQSVQSPATLAVTGVSSPATSSQQPPQQQQACSVDDKVYMEKLKQLQKYIEPLSRVIHKFNEDEEKHNKDYLKMKNLRDTLMNPQKRMPWSTLEKCEKVLQSWLDNRSTKVCIFL